MNDGDYKIDVVSLLRRIERLERIVKASLDRQQPVILEEVNDL
jgi:hypothetical protein